MSCRVIMDGPIQVIACSPSWDRWIEHMAEESAIAQAKQEEEEDLRKMYELYPQIEEADIDEVPIAECADWLPLEHRRSNAPQTAE